MKGVESYQATVPMGQKVTEPYNAKHLNIENLPACRQVDH